MEVNPLVFETKMCIRDRLLAYLFVTVHIVPVRNGLAVVVYTVEHDMHVWMLPVLMAHDDVCLLYTSRCV